MATNVGQKTIKTLSLVSSKKKLLFLTVENCDDGRFDCNYITPVLANTSGVDLENDKSSVLGLFEDWVTVVEFKLQKKESGVFVDKAIITDNTYGEFFPQGSFASKLKYAGFIADWSLIRPAFGDGTYRIKVRDTTPLGTSTNFSILFCLKEFNCDTKENTVRLEWFNNKKIGDIENDTEVLDFADINWLNQYRVPNSIFGYPKSTYETEEIQFQNGEFQDVTDIQTEIYILKIGLLPSFFHNLFKTLALMSGTLTISDYSTNNPQEIFKKAVKKSSGWEPRWSPQNKCAPVTIELEPRFNNLETDKC